LKKIIRDYSFKIFIFGEGKRFAPGKTTISDENL